MCSVGTHIHTCASFSYFYYIVVTKIICVGQAFAKVVISLKDHNIYRACDPNPIAIRWAIRMGGAGRSGDELRMVSRVSL